jgi:hypothetical protein
MRKDYRFLLTHPTSRRSPPSHQRVASHAQLDSFTQIWRSQPIQVRSRAVSNCSVRANVLGFSTTDTVTQCIASWGDRKRPGLRSVENIAGKVDIAVTPGRRVGRQQYKRIAQCAQHPHAQILPRIGRMMWSNSFWQSFLPVSQPFLHRCSWFRGRTLAWAMHHHLSRKGDLSVQNCLSTGCALAHTFWFRYFGLSIYQYPQF